MGASSPALPAGLDRRPAWYGISAGTEFLGSAFGWSEPLYRTWYLVGAFGVAAYLGLGTIYLLNRTRFGYFVAVSLRPRRPLQLPDLA